MRCSCSGLSSTTKRRQHICLYVSVSVSLYLTLHLSLYLSLSLCDCLFVFLFLCLSISTCLSPSSQQSISLHYVAGNYNSQVLYCCDLLIHLPGYSLITVI